MKNILKDLEDLRVASLPHLGRRKLNVYDQSSTGAGARSRMRPVGVSKGSKVYKKNLLVIGTGRCGTTWLSKTLIEAGFDVPHECVGEVGTVSLFFHTDMDWYPYIPWVTANKSRVAHIGERLSDFSFKHTLHIVRHPLEVIASMQGIIGSLNIQWMVEAGVCPVPYNHTPAWHRNLLYWRDCVKKCESLADATVTMKAAAGNGRFWNPMLKRAGLEKVPMPKLPPKNKSTGFKKHEPMTWAEVDAHDALLGKEVRKMARKLRLE